ncbi:MAG: CTP synthase (glutamine hydrolyzing) [Thermoplasmatales archaeon]|nr:CTP synthase (glutamine hydrolyzing) [Candidatus Thermoplasmatota archaeon]MDA8055367.1 CTP synthase (glutamine hydrolyzing) [Thermoplasmatales archaeon]
MRFVVITGGVISGIGKGTITSSLAYILRERNYKVDIVKIDPYINYDAGTMNPYQHGEVFVLSDGTEADLDLGNYERFLSRNLKSGNNLTTGKVYKWVIEKERRGDFLGSTVQIIPHVTDEIKRRIRAIGLEDNSDIVLIEVGGVVGDIESMPFLEALRQMRLEEDGKIFFIHVTYVPTLRSVGEPKTKPTQHSVKELRSIGIQPDAIIARSEIELDSDLKEKIALFTQVDEKAVISIPDVGDIFTMPLLLNDTVLPNYILDKIGLKPNESNMDFWRGVVANIKNPSHWVTIGVVGKYVQIKDSYISNEHSFMHVTGKTGIGVKLKWINSEKEDSIEELLKDVDGVLIPWGYGPRGTEGKIKAIRFARENKIPLLGICFGFQLTVIEFARNVLGLTGANSSELNPETRFPVIDLLPEQIGLTEKGGTMRLGDINVKIKKGTMAYDLYGKEEIRERHRHRYEVNPKYIKEIESKGMHFSATDESGTRMEILELENHPFFMGSQFHAEFISRPERPSILHEALVLAASKYNKVRRKNFIEQEKFAK